MMDVRQLAQHLLTLQPAQNLGRLTFYNFLKYLCQPDQIVTSELINSFYARAFLFQHWVQHKHELFSSIQADLMQIQDRGVLETNRAWRPEEIQLIQFENQHHLLDVAGLALEKRFGSSTPLRLLPEGENRGLALIRTPQHGLQVIQLEPMGCLIQGEISLLFWEFCLHYGADLTLQSEVTQQIDIGRFTSCVFQVDASKRQRGIFVRGYTFQKHSELLGEKLNPLLFYPLKRLEQFFIERKSDTTYVDLCTMLERATEGLKQGEVQAVHFASQALEHARLAMEQIYLEDKLLRLLIENLQRTLEIETRRDSHNEYEQKEKNYDSYT